MNEKHREEMKSLVEKSTPRILKVVAELDKNEGCNRRERFEKELPRLYSETDFDRHSAITQMAGNEFRNMESSRSNSGDVRNEELRRLLVPLFEKALRDPRKEVVSSAIEALGDLRSLRSASKIKKYLDDENDYGVFAGIPALKAIEALSRMGNPEAFPLITKKLKSKDLRMRVEAIDCLVKLNPQKSVSYLEKTLKRDKSPSVHRKILCALEELSARKSIPLIEKELDCADLGVRCNALLALQKLEARESIPKIEAILNGKKPTKNLDEDVGYSFERWVGSKSDIYNAIDALAAFGSKKSIPLIKKYVTNKDPEIAVIAKEAVARLSKPKKAPQKNVDVAEEMAARVRISLKKKIVVPNSIKKLQLEEKQRRVLNVMLNLGMIFVGGFQLAFIEGFAALTNSIGESLIKAFAGTKGSKKELAKNMTLFKKEMRADVVAGLRTIRQQVGVQFAAHRKEIQKEFSSEVCNECLAIIEKNKINLTPLTEELDDEEVLAYILLLGKPEIAQKVAVMIARLNELAEKYHLRTIEV